MLRAIVRILTSLQTCTKALCDDINSIYIWWKRNIIVNRYSFQGLKSISNMKSLHRNANCHIDFSFKIIYYPYVTFWVVGHFRNLNLQVLCFCERAWLIYLAKFAELSKSIHKCISIVVLDALLTNTWRCWKSHCIIVLRQEMHQIREFIQTW